MADLYLGKYRKDSIRLKGYDYSRSGAYFVTICVNRKMPLLGKCQNGIMCLSEIGQKAYQFWQCIPKHHENIAIDGFIIMPDHMHGVIIIKEKDASKRGAPWQNKSKVCADGRGAPWRTCTGIGPLKKNSLSSVVNQFKGSVKRWCNQNGYENFKWQSNYHESIIRSEIHLYNVRRYIRNNPKKWNKSC